MAVQESAAGAPAGATMWDRAAHCCTRWLDGDAEALDDLVRLMTPVLWQVARACSLTEESAEDVVQTTWVAFVRSAGRLRDAQSVGGWLTTTARREAWRVSQAGSRTTFVEDDTLERVVPRERSAEDAVVTRDESDQLWSAVGALDERCQMLLRVVAFADRPDYAGIARDLGMPMGSIGPTRMRCLGKLKALLDDRSSS